MTAYVANTVVTLFCTTAATYAAARDQTQAAAVFAAVSTILIGLEKSLLFREKWKFHLAIATRLFILTTKMQLESADANTVADEYASILDNYASSIPIAGRESQ